MKIIQEIIDLDGDCLDYVRCLECPFKSTCLPEFLNIKSPSKAQRESMALRALVHHSLLEDDSNIEAYTWDKK